MEYVWLESVSLMNTLKLRKHVLSLYFLQHSLWVLHLKIIVQLLNEILLSEWHYNREQLNNVLLHVALMIWELLHVIEWNIIGMILNYILVNLVVHYPDIYKPVFINIFT